MILTILRQSSRVDHFSTDGLWWLPEGPEHRTRGRLTFDSDGLCLALSGSLDEEDATIPVPWHLDADWATTPIVHGTIDDGSHVTLFKVEPVDFQQRYEDSGASGTERGVYRVDISLHGAHITSDSFIEAQVEFDCLTPWLRPPPMVDWPEGPPVPRLRLDELELARAQVDGGELILCARGTGTIATYKVQWEQQTFAGLKFEPTAALNIVAEWIRPIQDFLVFVLGRPVRITALRFRAANPSVDDLDAKWVVGCFEAVQPDAGSPVDVSTIVRRSAATLFMFNDCPLPFDAIASRWFSLRKKMRTSISLLHATHYVNFMFGEHRYASVFQSAEALAKSLGLSGKEKSPIEHRDRVAAIISAARAAEVDGEVVAWAERVLNSRNDKPLWQQIHDLTASTGGVGATVLAACPDFGRIVAGGRTSVSHGGATDILDSGGKYWHSDVLRWIVRTRILIELGVDVEEADRRLAGKAAFRHSVAKIGGTA